MTNLRRIGTVAAALAFSVAPALARLDVTLDADTLNDLLANMAPDHAEVALTAGKKLTIQMKDMKVTGFDPTAGPNGGLATSLRLIVPDLSIDTPVAPHLTLDLKEAAGGKKTCFLRFDRVMLNLPLTGSVDIAALLPPLPLMPDAGWVVNSARGRVLVKANLIDAKTGAKNIRLGFDLELSPAP
ncbi:MAG TPA: hypothetical protein VFB67_04815 [Candidatus Polarisedimenticolaceae bacterium]|nr:hypothetical protein [Candidatus Polarisedimenticolaceae bacterium]